MKRFSVCVRAAFGVCLLAVFANTAAAQDWNLGGKAGEWLSDESEGKLKLNGEVRFRYEDRTGQSFGKAPDLSTGLLRTQLSLTYTPESWLKFSGTVQDSRAPWYGNNAPNSVRDQADLEQGYFELFPDRKTGFGMTAGRMMLNYGEGRLIGIPLWSNIPRSYDHARVYYRLRGARFEFLMVSPVKVRIGDFNRPNLGDRIWGGYTTLPDVWRKAQVDIYVLRRDQNAPGGFTGGSRLLGTDKLRIDTFGGRMAGPLGWGLKYSLEGAWQNGKVGPAQERAAAWYSALSRKWSVAGKPLEVLAEYKYASGTKDPSNTLKTSTFDQLYAANHDRFGHADLFGWRNLHNVRSLTSYGLLKNVAVNFQYDNYWLASARDSLYNGSGMAIVRSAAGTAGRHVGQETDIFATYKYNCMTWGSGYGYLFAGQFVKKTTPGVSPTYAYVFQTYTF